MNSHPPTLFPSGLERSIRAKDGRQFSRSGQMVDALRREFLYSEKRVRDILFVEIESVLCQTTTPLTVARLTRQAAIRGRERARQAGFEFGNWETATKATINAMLRAGVLLSQGGSPIPLSIAAPAAEVTALAEQFRDLTEAHLLEVVIRKLGDVTARDHKALAHALFRQFDTRIPMEDLEDRVVTLLAMLTGRIGLATGGTYLGTAAGRRIPICCRTRLVPSLSSSRRGRRQTA